MHVFTKILSIMQKACVIIAIIYMLDHSNQFNVNIKIENIMQKVFVKNAIKISNIIKLNKSRNNKKSIGIKTKSKFIIRKIGKLRMLKINRHSLLVTKKHHGII